MKKTIYLFIYLILFISINSCSGYKPIFSASKIEFKIADYSLLGDTKLGHRIYSKLYNLTQFNENNNETQNIYVEIKVSKQKNATAKNSAGKILEYRINLNTDVLVKDYLTEVELLNHSFNSSFSYKVQDQYSETIKLENKSINDLINKTYQDLLIKLVENITIK